MTRTFTGICHLVFAAWITASYSIGSETQQFQELLADDWEFSMRESPLWATQTGDHRYNDRLGSVTLEDRPR